MKLSQTNGPLFRFYGDDITATLTHMKRVGFRYIDVSFFSRFVPGTRYWTRPQEIIDEYKRCFDELELVPVQCHEPAGNSMGDDGGEYYMKKTPAAIAIAAAIGVPLTVVHPGNSPIPLTHDQTIEENVKALRRLMPVAEKYNMKIALENLHNTVSTADDLIAIVDEVNHPLLGVNWDVGHANMNGLDQYEEITKLGKRLWSLHLHDNGGPPAAHGADWHLPPFYGNINYDAIMRALLAVGYAGTFNFEADGPEQRPGRLPLVIDGETQEEKLHEMPAFLREEADRLLYHIGKHILETYDSFSE